ncbi:arsenate reductase family protein [Enterococcus sp. BWB1-3]|uniref:arsenate reductase family protein n=1 Tax=Enterococcus sp. BWB1-3 TaxID=2787713 RepID=UPI001924455F|nr:arsenate reductase family protein [Enterococcus sp. BWB1-3]MBL1227949.1 arsenate reductase family protein [Enterococcus sp. BWB1-3]
MYTFYWYPKCSTCKKAKAWLDASGVEYKTVNMIETPPTEKQLTEWMNKSPLPVRRFFNTSGGRYREQGLKDIVNDFSVEEASKRLSKDGMLNKRPILVKDGEFITNGFKESDYEGAFKA